MNKIIFGKPTSVYKSLVSEVPVKSRKVVVKHSHEFARIIYCGTCKGKVEGAFLQVIITYMLTEGVTNEELCSECVQVIAPGRARLLIEGG